MAEETIERGGIHAAQDAQVVLADFDFGGENAGGGAATGEAVDRRSSVVSLTLLYND